MVMGPTHAASGAALGLLVAAVLPTSLGAPTTAVGALAFAAVTAGAALLPDIDTPQATVSRSFGPISLLIAHGCDAVSLLIYRMTSGDRDHERHSGHRTATHTVWFAMVVGVFVAATVAVTGRQAASVTLFVMLSLAIRGLLPEWSHRVDWLGITIAAGVASAAVWRWQPQIAGGAALGAAVALGVCAHLVGDGLTKSGVPAFGGVVSIGGRRWHDMGAPTALRIRADGLADKALLVAFTAATILLGYVCLAHPATIGGTWPPILSTT